MEGSAAVRFGVGCWKPREFSETVDKILGTVQAGVVTAVSYRVAWRVTTIVTAVSYRVAWRVITIVTAVSYTVAWRVIK